MNLENELTREDYNKANDKMAAGFIVGLGSMGALVVDRLLTDMGLCGMQSCYPEIVGYTLVASYIVSAIAFMYYGCKATKIENEIK